MLFGTFAGTGVFLIQKETLFEREGTQQDRMDVCICYMSEVLFNLSSTLNLLYAADFDDIEGQEYLQGGEVFHCN